MAEPSTHNNYSFEDIQRYLQGKMPAAEMHAIEKAALQDPFLADAIEGYADVQPIIAQQHLKEINAALIGKKEELKVVAFNKKTQWLNVAAVIIVLAGIGIVTTYMLGSSSTQNKQTEIAKVQQAPVKNQAASDSILASSNSNVLTKKADSNLLIAENKATKKTQPTSAKRKGAATVILADNNALNEMETDSFKTDITGAVVSSAPAPEKTMASLSFAIADTQLQGKVSGLSVLPSTFSGKVVDENSKPIPYTTIETIDKKAVVVTDVNGDFSIQKNDTVLNVTASTVGYDSKAANLEAGNNNVIKLRGTTSALNDVVVVGYGTERRQKNSHVDSATPVIGWKNFNNYVMTQLNKDTTAPITNNPNDLVEIEFLIDKLGNPYNIMVTKSVDDAKTAKAVEILKNGPKWTNTSKKRKAKVTISF